MSHSDQLLHYPFEPGDLVSTEIRFRSRGEYKAAVQAYGNGEYDDSKHSYSIALGNNEERLLRHQPSHNYPSDCVIAFRFSPERNLKVFQDSYEQRTKYQGYQEVEYPGRGFRGEKDRFDTYRAILLPPQSGKRVAGAAYEGYIINPPYPRLQRVPEKGRFGIGRKYLAGALGLAAGLGVVALFRRRAQL